MYVLKSTLMISTGRWWRMRWRLEYYMGALIVVITLHWVVRLL